MSVITSDSTVKRDYEVVVILGRKDEPGVLRSRINENVTKSFGAELTPIFQPDPTLDGGGTLAEERSRFFSLDANDDEVEEIVRALRARDDVETVYAERRGSIPQPAAATCADQPDLMALQAHLSPAPIGVDAFAAWSTPGGNGQGIQVIDVEENWNFNHENLQLNRIGAGVVVGVVPPSDPQHGTAVLGTIGANHLFGGTKGIAFAATIGGAAITDRFKVGDTIDQAARQLRPGDILLIEWEIPGPGGIRTPVEWRPLEFMAIRTAVSKGIIVVSAAGNGGVRLDSSRYDTPITSSSLDPDNNPFRRRLKDSGSILVGAGAPPPGTHGKDFGPNCSRLPESNFGDCIDAQGWGREVTTTGIGDLPRGNGLDSNKFYTCAFPETSAAAAMVAGVIACVQGVRRAAGKAPFTPAAMRAALRDHAHGTPQPTPVTEPIGSRPDLAKLVAFALSQP